MWKKWKMWRHMIFTPPPPVTNCHTFSDPLPPLERDILYGRPLICSNLTLFIVPFFLFSLFSLFFLFFLFFFLFFLFFLFFFFLGGRQTAPQPPKWRLCLGISVYEFLEIGRKRMEWTGELGVKPPTSPSIRTLAQYGVLHLCLTNLIITCVVWAWVDQSIYRVKFISVTMTI